jgi:hypothetical protein
MENTMALEQHHDISVGEEPRKRHLSPAPTPQPGKPRSRPWAWVALTLVVVAIAVTVVSQMIDDGGAVSDGSFDVAEELRFGRIAEQQQAGDGSSEAAEQARLESLNPNPVSDGSSEAAEQARLESLNPSDS